MTSHSQEGVQTIGDDGVTIHSIDEGVLDDLESKVTDVACPVHGGQPAFELLPDGTVVESFCCETLLTIVRELQVATGERAAATEDERAAELD